MNALAVHARLAMLTEQVKVIEYQPHTEEGIRISAQVRIDPDNPLLPGHFPGLPVFPGVCQIDCVHRTVLVAAQIEGVTPVLLSVLTARFLRMVTPREDIEINTLITKINGEWRVKGVLRRESDPVARVGLRYVLSPGGVS